MCKDFYKYVQSKIKLYEHFKEPCLKEDTKKCPEFYAQCVQYHPEKVLPHHDCYNEIMQDSTIAVSRVPQIINRHTVDEPESEEENDGRMPVGSPKLNENTHNIRMYGNVLLGVVATTMTSGALYRFTPLGSMLRNGFGRNNNMRNLNIGDNGLFDYTSESFNQYTWGGEEHYIGYQPA
ncbi:hypothetical protein PVNG_03102 [Plasmodium vivax North Korean]|uniref:Vir protein n=1 Tax=Plasmodium vivax North Korean TaxID=1035514 RepID=A0A0J9TZ24_PLAVI|nr:hypothetical protein PVNG_03102 [Plasmodium vivax North Korean]